MVHGPDVTPPRGWRLWLGLASPRFVPILNCRLAYFFYIRRLVVIAKLFSTANFFLYGLEIAIRCPIGPGLFLPHTQGTVIGAARIGANVTIYQGVTLGAREVDFAYGQDTRPIVEDGVIIGSGAKVIGGVTLGHGARIGANSVVLASVPAETLVIGIPARDTALTVKDGHANT
ncbi:hypothetical protein OK349_09240 [Sphingomonas sp. BT-65]|uniref:serine O-acetyltransferase n=1 Tax=Sphingomonas sp. BT-65 TaxID=2989821 RepID=UPI0022368FEC|nr:DapH/DapD/GlmU-related protein [Sphingomonas sp. BT-65]MCW4461892.1 hypothetical protein [Sphingomonas sp. BT-65]